MEIHQSDLASWARCPQQVALGRKAAADGRRIQTLSATVFGTVIHHAVQILETLHHEGRPDALDVAIATWEHYWHPDHVGELEPGGIDVWLPRQTWAGLQIRGRDNIRAYYVRLIRDDGKLLALEVPFSVPITIDGRHHVVAGTIDRLALRRTSRGGHPYISIEDFKSGAKPTYLRHALQWTLYAWATIQAPFWSVWPPEVLDHLSAVLSERGVALYADGTARPVIPRRGRWIALRDAFAIHDAGWRTPVDFARMRIALSEYVRSNTAEIFPLSISGQTCTYCAFAYDGSCGGIPIDPSGADEGRAYSQQGEL